MQTKENTQSQQSDDNKQEQDFRELGNLIDAIPDCDLKDINDWFELGVSLGKDKKELLATVDRWSRQKERTTDVRAKLGQVLQLLDPKRDFEVQTETIEQHLTTGVTREQLSNWWKAGVTAEQDSASLVRQLEAWAGKGGRSKAALDDLLQEYEDVMGGKPVRSAFMANFEKYNLTPIDGTTAGVFKGDEDKYADKPRPVKRKKQAA